jgi:glycosyltransferase involved in cell wall biosynthesis
MDRVSVCLAFRNGERFLRQQIDSILPQLNPDDEVICSNDHSTDQSMAILESYQDKRIKIIQSNSKNNHVKNFETALLACSGEYIFLADQDDVWENEKVSRVKTLLQEYDLILTDCLVIDSHDAQLHNSIFEIHSAKKGIVRNYLKNAYMGCCMAFRKKVFDKALPFPNQLKAHDQWIGLVAEKYFKVHFLPVPLIKYRKHENNYSQTGEKSTLKLIDQISYRFRLLKDLWLR